MAGLPENSLDACVTDPPYGLSFMGKSWDHAVPGPDYWREVLRVLKPGAHLLAFGGTRTNHRMVCAIEDAGFEIRDSLQWIFGSGFPKSLDVSKAIDKAAGAEREVVGRKADPRYLSPADSSSGSPMGNISPRVNGGINYERAGFVTAPATDAAREWSGWGTALKPAYENITCAQKPLDLRTPCAIAVRTIMEATCLLPSLVRDAGNNSALSQSVFGMDAERGFAQWNAVLACNTPAALFDLMATSPFGSETPSSLNIVLSWLNILGELLSLGNTFTTEMKTSLTTDLKILNSLLSQNTPSIIIEAATCLNGIESNALPVRSIFSAVAAKLNCTRDPSVPAHATWMGNGADLRPNCAPIVLARKPLSEKTVAANVLRWGCGALNIDACRVAGDKQVPWGKPSNVRASQGWGMQEPDPTSDGRNASVGRWPANILHDGSDEVVAMFPETGPSPQTYTRKVSGTNDQIYGAGIGEPAGKESLNFGDSGSAARFFYCAKAPRSERGDSKHPTVKPVKLMRYLVRLITPPGGTVLDCFAGSGTTGEAALNEGFSALLIERDEQYVSDIRRRVERVPRRGASVDKVSPASMPPSPASMPRQMELSI